MLPKIMVLYCIIIANGLSEMWPGHILWDLHIYKWSIIILDYAFKHLGCYKPGLCVIVLRVSGISQWIVLQGLKTELEFVPEMLKSENTCSQAKKCHHSEDDPGVTAHLMFHRHGLYIKSARTEGTETSLYLSHLLKTCKCNEELLR